MLTILSAISCPLLPLAAAAPDAQPHSTELLWVPSHPVLPLPRPPPADAADPPTACSTRESTPAQTGKLRVLNASCKCRFPELVDEPTESSVSVLLLTSFTQSSMTMCLCDSVVAALKFRCRRARLELLRQAVPASSKGLYYKA